MPSLEWTDCFDGLTCASAEVPLDYDEPDGRTIGVGLVRMAATDPESKIGSVFVGAPGSSSGVNLIGNFGSFIFDDEMRARFDIIGFDRRAVARTMPVRCFDTGAEMTAFHNAADPYPLTRAEMVELAEQAETFAEGCEQRSGDLLAHASSADVARDLDLLRQAVGDDKLNYIGHSHSAYVGLIYANLFPDRIRSLVLDGPQFAPAYPTGPSFTAPFSRTQADLGAEVALQEFFDQCRTAGVEACPFAAGDDLEAKYDQLSERLRRNPLGPELGWPDNFGADELAAHVSFQLFSPASYATLGQQLQELYEKTAPGPRTREGATATAAQPEDYPNGTDAFSAIFCADMDTPRSVRSLEFGADRRDRFSPRFGRFYAYYTRLCTAYPGPAEDRYTGPWRTETSAPALVLGNMFDPITFLPGVRAVTKLIPDSRMLTLRAWGHTSLAVSQCANAAIADYVIRGTLPARGTVCESDQAPFE